MILIRVEYDGNVEENNQLLKNYYSNAIPRKGERIDFNPNKKDESEKDWISWKVVHVIHNIIIDPIGSQKFESVEILLQ